jgi:hypothetical protein
MLAALVVVNIIIAMICVDLARRMAIHRGRIARPWMWAAAFFGPFPLPILALLAKKPEN